MKNAEHLATALVDIKVTDTFLFTRFSYAICRLVKVAGSDRDFFPPFLTKWMSPYCEVKSESMKADQNILVLSDTANEMYIPPRWDLYIYIF